MKQFLIRFFYILTELIFDIFKYFLGVFILIATLIIGLPWIFDFYRYCSVVSQFNDFHNEHYQVVSSFIKSNEILPLLNYRFKEIGVYPDRKLYYCYVDYFQIPKETSLENLSLNNAVDIKLDDIDTKFPNWEWSHSCIDYHKYVAGHGNYKIDNSIWLPYPFSYAKIEHTSYEDPNLLIKGNTENVNKVTLSTENISKILAYSFGNNFYRALVLYPKQHIIKVVTSCDSNNCRDY
ncbi:MULTISPECIES: hypothetical protein [Pasteurellaceae]|uniref:Uncharacterized protein n=1 Tax=Pasteurella atlantica TaxID=2827233 RepID=A0AAW8CQW0_9PAST|nr:hypothetical protein [Pasteurella atlantica]MBR0573972.1 hypothetical protein [Pasteurella atlantica]MDP8039935.1 hypothetical protein [Pasteurella atlantica]MDP8042011.1 hypothetical protein [Pasteurella atlantica]MDP8044196.1 hypothetical protein [Pasteurella atlantica]MDP8046239.1 hypothetical protein [Pasteurella atlantica]